MKNLLAELVRLGLVATLLSVVTVGTFELVTEPKEVSAQTWESTVTEQPWGYLYTLGNGDIVEVGDNTTADFKAMVKTIRHTGVAAFSLGWAGGTFTPSLDSDVVSFNFNKNIDVKIYPVPPSDRLPEGGIEYNIGLNKKPAKPTVTLDIDWVGITWQKILPLDVEYDQALCEEEWGIDAAPYAITSTSITGSDSVVYKTREEYEVNSYLGTAIDNYHSNSGDLGGGVTYTNISRSYLYIHRGQMTDALGATAWVEDINIDEQSKSITFDLPIVWLRNAEYPVSQVCGVDPAYTEDIDSWDSSTYGTDGTWSDYDLFTNKGVPKGAVAEVIMSNQEPGVEALTGIRGTEESADYGGSIRALTNDGTYIYAGGVTTNKVNKYLMSNMTYISQSADYGGTIYTLTNDGTYVYAGGFSTQTVRKYYLGNMTLADESADYGGSVYALTNDGTYVYAAGEITQTVRKYYSNNMTLADESADYGGTVWTLTNDGTYVYAGGATTNKVSKYYSNNMTLAGQSASYGDSILALTNYGTYVYAAGDTTHTVRKYYSGNMTLADESADYGSIIYALTNDGTFVYAGGYITQTIRKYLMSDMSYSTQSTLYGGTIRALTNYGTYVYAGGVTTQTIRKYLMTTLAGLSRYVDLHEAEGGGVTTCRMFVVSGLNTGKVETYSEDISDANFFYLVGYWENVGFTENSYSVKPDGNGAWEDEYCSTGASAVHHVVIGVWNEYASPPAITVGIRENGSSLERKILIHETETGGYSVIDLMVKSDASKTIDAYSSDTTNAWMNDFGYFGTELDFVELFQDLTLAGSSNWQAIDLTAYLDQDGRTCDFLLTHHAIGNSVAIGVRDGDSSVERKISEHEAEDDKSSTGELTGFGMSAVSNATGVVDVITGTIASCNFYLMGYFKPAAAPGTPDISNTPAAKALGTVVESSSYWSSSSAPTFPLDDGECFFTITNSSGAAVDITIESTNWTGGNGWTLSSSVGEAIVVLKAGKSGDANEAAMVTVTTSPQSFITSLADSGTKKWEVKLETGTFTDGVLKECTITLTATLS